MSEKRKPTYDLVSIQQEFCSPAKLEATLSAVRDAFALGLDESDIVRIIQSIERKHFVKSMTTYHDHTVWQDVYNVPSEVGVLYIKFMEGVVTQFKLVSFKERG